MAKFTAISIGIGLAAGVLLAGCTTQLNAVRAGSGTSIPMAGAPYNLSFTQYDVTISRRVGACEAVSDQGMKPALVIAMDAKIARKEQRDPSRSYVIDLDSLQSGWKTSSVEVEYHDNGTLKSINASAEDRTGQILASTAVSLGKLVTAFAAAAATADGRPADVCKKATIDTLKLIKDAEGSITARTNRLERLVNDLDGMTKVATAMGAAWSKTERKQFAGQVKAVHAARDDLSIEQRKLADLLAKVSNVEKFTWPVDGKTFKSDVETSLIPDIPITQIREWGATKDPKQVQIATRVFAKIESTSPIGTTDPCTEGCAEDKVPGLKYRMPASGRFLICSAPSCDRTKDELVKVDEGVISQLGRVFTLPLRSAMFSKKSVVATFNDAGQPTKIGVKSEAAAAETAVTSLGSIADALISTRKAAVPSELDRIKSETELLKAQSDLAAARKALESPANVEATTATAAFAADTALLQAQLANLQAKAALDAATKTASN